MIVVDTNVISEPLKPVPNSRVLHWLVSQSEQSLFFSSISLAEILFGMAIMRDGKRKNSMVSGFEDLARKQFGDRILHFDAAAARCFAELAAKMRAAGQGIALFDCQIAAIALAHDFAVATRDERPFRAAGLRVINPWAETGEPIDNPATASPRSFRPSGRRWP
ncbi:MAG: type II toxin-antitoxin system VapC family toxin [Aestuariivirga sp.]